MKGIYKITNLVTNKVYIGKSKNIESRWRQHIYDLNNNRHHSYKLQYDWNVFKEDNFKFEVVEICDDTASKEKYYIDKYDSINNGYNIANMTGKEIVYSYEDNVKSTDVNLNIDLMKSITRDCGISAMSLYVILLSHKVGDINSCSPSTSLIMAECNISKPTFSNIITKLVDYGYVKVSSGNIHGSSKYYFPLEQNMYTDDEIEFINKIERRKGSNKKKRLKGE